jgi:hypothetical protein
MKGDSICEGCDNNGASYELMIWDVHGWLFFFLVCDYSDVGDGTRFTGRKTPICEYDL